jgi:oxygen-independent coproporphyrinogen-3 oxidase
MKDQSPSLGLYIHVPFCRSKCAYCDFYSLADSGGTDDYMRAVSAHLSEVAPRAASHSVDTVYFGGGTPTVLGTKNLVSLLSLIKKKYPVSPDAEITLEANPESARDWKALRALRRAGFNRVSLGMQSADDAELRLIGRIHTFGDVSAAVEAIRKAKIKNLSLDLIYGLPSQSLDGWKNSLAAAVALGPEHISCYGLKIEEGTPLFGMKSSLVIPDDDAQADMYFYAVDYLAQNGYAQYEISNFAKDGFYSRHNMKYWTLGEYAGFGPGAHSDFGSVRYAYVRDLAKYVDGVLRGSDMLSESETIPPLVRDTEYIMLRLRTARGVDGKEFERMFREHFDALDALFEKYAASGFAEKNPDGSWRLTPRGFFVSNTIIVDALDALARDKESRQARAASGDFTVL